MTCYIFGAGECRISSLSVEGDDMVIAADGGLEHVKRLGISPNLVIGDFDSLGYVPACESEVLRLPAEKDLTDIAAAVDVGRGAGYLRFVLFGATGGRPDHTYANYQLLHDIALHGEEGYMIGDDYSATVIGNGSSLMFDKDFSGTLSVFAIGGDATGVCECGTKYTLTNASLMPNVPLGVSNAFAGKDATVSVKYGNLLVMWEGQRLPIKNSLTGSGNVL